MVQKWVGPVRELDRLGEGVAEVGFSVVEGTVEGEPLGRIGITAF